MNRSTFTTRLAVASIVAGAVLLSGSSKTVVAQTAPARTDSGMRKTTAAQRKAAAERVAAARLRSQSAATSQSDAAAAGVTPLPGCSRPSLNPLGTPDYMGGCVPNYANSPLPSADPDNPGKYLGGIRKFVDTLPGLGSANRNNLGQYLPVAIPDTTTYPGSDYYEISLVEYYEKMHTDLPATRLRGYVQTNTSDATVNVPHYLGPMIVAQKDRPVRVKFTNKLPTGAGGNLFLPVDTTVMGAGRGPNGTNYTQNRATLHLHGGATPWISDGTPHQWITPAGETTDYPKGVSVSNVPDMPDPGDGSMTFFYTNQQSARLMFYHDHAYGLTRLNVYGGEAAGYVLEDPVEQTLINGGTVGAVTVAAGTIPADQIPLIIQDKTFVPDTAALSFQDPTWDLANWGALGSLWFPHVYMPNQKPGDLSGANPMGRWDYGPWFWPIVPVSGLIGQPFACPSVSNPNQLCPGTPNPSIVPEAFMDTPVVNGTAYPTVTVAPKPYRLRILNAANDRFFNLQLYVADPNVVTPDGRSNTEVKMVPAVPTSGWPDTWPADAREGGVPDPTTAGPAMIQIATEGGLMAAPVTIEAQPVGYNFNRRDIVVLNVQEHALFLGAAERADVIVDFSQFAGRTLILYNDAPAPVPAFDPRFDYYTGDPDQTDTGGAPTTVAGYGPNTRTIMQIQVSGGTGTPYDSTGLAAALAAAFTATQPELVVPPATYAAIQDTSMRFTPAGEDEPRTINLGYKAIAEEFELEYGRMNATMGVEMPFSNINIQTTIPLGYHDPMTEEFDDGEVQVWKITHNGVDTHAVHFHLFNVQLVNRVGWDGAIRPPDANEVGWKETVKMNPLEDAIVAMKPIAPQMAFGVPNSSRPLDPTQPVGATISLIDPTDGNPANYVNALTNFGWEYVWHCHLLGHEENDMMRPIKFEFLAAGPPAPSGAAASGGLGPVTVSWTDPTPLATALSSSSQNEIGFRIERETIAPVAVAFATLDTVRANATTYVDATVAGGTTYGYRVSGFNASGPGGANAFSTASNTATVTTTGGCAVPIVVSPTTLPAAGNAGVSAYSQTITQSGGAGTATFAVTSGTLPTGLTLSTSGALTGTPTSGGTFTFTVTATDVNGCTGSRAYSVAVGASTLTASPMVLNYVAMKLGAGGAITSVTPVQTVTVNASTGTAWTASADQSWVQIANGTWTGAGQFTVGIVNPGNVIGGTTSAVATVTISSAAAGLTRTIPVTLIVDLLNSGSEPYGSFDAPADNATGITGAISVSGWALDDVGVSRVQIWRNCVEAIDRPAGACMAAEPGGPGNFVYIGDGVFLSGARPDVEALDRNLPLAYRAGWGNMILTNAFPHVTNGTPTGGQGTFTLSAHALDVEGRHTLLGTKTITLDNDNATLPFGAIDTPEQGGTVTSGVYANFGWAMTQNPKCIDTTTTASYRVYIDGVSRTLTPGTNWFPGLTRSDIAGAYPGLCNTDNALAAYHIDATALGLSNGQHTIGWDVIDSGANTAGIGSRVFNLLMGGAAPAAAGASDRPAALASASYLGGFAPSARRIRVMPEGNGAGPAGATSFVQLPAGGRITLDLGGPVEAGYQVAGDDLRALPTGSTLDAANGTFYWQPPAAFLGPFPLVFVNGTERQDVLVTIVDPTADAGVLMYIDLPADIASGVSASETNASVTVPFVVAGWAFDPQAMTGSGIDALHVWAYRRDVDAPPAFLGAADIGGARPDVGAAFGNQFGASGFSVTVPQLEPGIYDLLAYPWSHRTGRFEDASRATVTVR